MFGSLKTAIAWAGAATFLLRLQPAASKSQLILATDSAPSKSWAATAAHQNAIDTAVARQHGWTHVTLRRGRCRLIPSGKRCGRSLLRTCSLSLMW